MKNTRILTKVFSATIACAMLLSVSTYASTVKVPNMGGVSKEYADVVSKASFLGPIQNLSVESFVAQCIDEASLNRAIENANLASSTISGIKYLDYANKDYTQSLSGNSNGWVRDIGTVNSVNAYLTNASIGPISMKLVKEYITIDGKTDAEYYHKLYLDVDHSLFSNAINKTLVNFTGSSVDLTASQTSTFFSDYAKFLSSLKTFYKAAGCYTTTTDNTTDNTKKPVTDAKDAVIKAKDVTIKVGDDFDIMNKVTAKDNDGKGKDLTDQITAKGEVNTAVAGTYEITYKVTGENGKAVKKVITVTVEAAPVVAKDATITVESTILNVGDTFDALKNVKAVDDAGNGKDITDLVTYTGSVDTTKAGEYKVTYCVIGENGTKVTKEVTVTVNKTKEDAVITAEDKTINVGDEFDNMTDVTAFDKGGKGKDITDKVKVTGKVDVNKVGTYELTYEVTGVSGNKVTKTVKITVVKAKEDAIIEASDRTIKLGADFDKLKGVTAYDNGGNGKNLINKVTVTGKVDTNTAGVYEVTYTVTGANGNEVSKTVKVTVVDDKTNTTSNTTSNTTNKTTAPTCPCALETGKCTTTCTTNCQVQCHHDGIPCTCKCPTPGCTPETPCSKCTTTTTTTCTYNTPGCTQASPCSKCNTTSTTTCTYHTPGCTPVNPCSKCTTTVTTTCTYNTPSCTPTNPCSKCEPVNTTCAPVNTTCVPVVNTTCVPVVNTTCAPIAPIVCVPENLCDKCSHRDELAVCPNLPIVIKVDPIKIELTKPGYDVDDDDTDDVASNTTNAPVAPNTMRPTGANLAELGLSALGLLGTAIAVIRRRR